MTLKERDENVIKAFTLKENISSMEKKQEVESEESLSKHKKLNLERLERLRLKRRIKKKTMKKNKRRRVEL